MPGIRHSFTPADATNGVKAPLELIFDSRLSYRARGVWLFIQTLPEGTRVTPSMLAKEGPGGRDAAKSALAELYALGWLKHPEVKASTHNTKRHEQVHRIAGRDAGFFCHYCGIGLVDVCADEDIIVAEDGGRTLDPASNKQFPTFDHLIPQEFGGSDIDSNLVLSCQRCNSRKGAR